MEEIEITLEEDEIEEAIKEHLESCGYEVNSLSLCEDDYMGNIICECRVKND